MRVQPWHVDELTADLRTEFLTATLDARFPGRGLSTITPGDDRRLPGHLLAVGGDSRESEEPLVPREFYCRGNDLIVNYERFGQDLQAEAYWRARTATDPQSIDLQVSVHTSRLDDRPALFTSTCLPAADVLRLKSAAERQFEIVDLSGGECVELSPNDGEGCVIWRLPGTNYSYAETIHPSDFRRDELSVVSTPEPMCRLVHHLFPSAIEKGVILRARVRGIFVDLTDDQNVVAAAYAKFAQEAPPLEV